MELKAIVRAEIENLGRDDVELMASSEHIDALSSAIGANNGRIGIEASSHGEPLLQICGMRAIQARTAKHHRRFPEIAGEVK